MQAHELALAVLAGGGTLLGAAILWAGAVWLRRRRGKHD